MWNDKVYDFSYYCHYYCYCYIYSCVRGFGNTHRLFSRGNVSGFGPVPVLVALFLLSMG